MVFRRKYIRCKKKPLWKSLKKFSFQPTCTKYPRHVQKICLTRWWLNILVHSRSIRGLLTHDYQQTEPNEVRCIDNTKLVDSIEIPLKSCKDVLTAVKKCYLVVYIYALITFLLRSLVIGQCNWPMQFYIDFKDWSPALQNVVPLIGLLHIVVSYCCSRIGP